MATEHEIDRLLVRMVGDGSSYQNMMKEAEQTTDKVTKEVKEDAKQIEQTGRSLEAFAKSVVGAVTAYLGVAQLRDFFNAFSVQEQSEVRLRAALEANERQVDKTFQRYMDFASALQVATNQGDELTLVLLQQVETFGLTGDAAERAVANATALARAQNKSVQEVLRLTSRFELGDLNALNELVPTLKNITDESEKVAEAQRQMSKALVVTEALAQTGAGQIEGLEGNIGDLKEMLGATVAEALTPIIKALRELVLWMQSLSPEIKSAIVIVGTTTVAVVGLSAAYGLLKLALTPLTGLIAAKTAGLTASAVAMRATSTAANLLKGAILLGAVVAFAELTKEVTGANAALDKLNEELTQTREIDKQIREMRQNRLETFIEDTLAIKDMTLRSREFRQELERTQRESEQLRDNLREAEKALRDADTGARRIPIFGFGHQAEFDLLTQNVQTAKETLEASQEAVRRLRQEIKMLPEDPIRPAQPFRDFWQLLKAMDFSIKGFGLSLREAIDLANDLKRQSVEPDLFFNEENIQNMIREFGLAGKEAELFTLALKKELPLGVIPLAEIERRLGEIQRRADIVEVMDALRTSIKDLNVEARVLADIVAAESSFDRPLIDAEKNVIRLRAQLESIPTIGKEVRDAFEDISNKAEDAAEEIRKINEAQQLLERSRDVIESIKTPEERHKEAIEELDEMFKRNMLTLNQYNKAVAIVNEQLASQTQTTKELRQELERIEGVLAGTAEAQFRIAQHREALRLPRRDPLRMVPIPDLPGFEVDRGNMRPVAGGIIPQVAANMGPTNDKQERIAKALEKLVVLAEKEDRRKKIDIMGADL